MLGEQVVVLLLTADLTFEVGGAEQFKEQSRVRQPLTQTFFPVLAVVDGTGFKESVQLALRDDLALLAQQVVEADDEVVVVLAVVSAGEGKKTWWVRLVIGRLPYS